MNLVHILGDGDLAHEFYSFAGLQSEECIFYGKKEIDEKKYLLNLNSEDLIYVPIASPIIRKKIFLQLLEDQIIPNTYIHPTVQIGIKTTIGNGSIIQPNVIISNNVSIGIGIFINCNSNIGHDVSIKDYSTIYTNVNIGGHAIIGENVVIGTGSILIPKIKIINNTTVGAGSVVIRSITEAGTYFGNPSKKIL